MHGPSHVRAGAERQHVYMKTCKLHVRLSISVHVGGRAACPITCARQACASGRLKRRAGIVLIPERGGPQQLAWDGRPAAERAGGGGYGHAPCHFNAPCTSRVHVRLSQPGVGCSPCMCCGAAGAGVACPLPPSWAASVRPTCTPCNACRRRQMGGRYTPPDRGPRMAPDVCRRCLRPA